MSEPIEESLTWEWFEDQEEEKPDYENAARIEFNLRADHPSVVKAADALTAGLEGNNAANRTHMAVVLLNLYRCYLLDPEKWVVYVRRKGNYDLVFKYNRNRIAWTSLVRVFDHLEALELADSALGFFYRGQEVEKGKSSRVRAKSNLIERLTREYAFTPELIQSHPDTEIILLRNTEKKPADYNDTGRNGAAAKRAFLRSYNAFLESQYIDLDADGFKPSVDLRIDLSRKQMIRVFNNNSFELGGRLYCGWWQEIPSDLRQRIIINNMKTVEHDYSGVHIHLLYAQEGKDFSKYGRDAYTLPDYSDDPKTRNLFKSLLLIAINAAPLLNPDGTIKMTGATRALHALHRKVRTWPDDYPDQLPDLKQALSDFGKYHAQIKHHFYQGRGLGLMYRDSRIAEDVLKMMMSQNIPVLPIHDSFVCPKLDEDQLVEAMKVAYRKHCNFDVSKALDAASTRRAKPAIMIKRDELDRNIEYPIIGDEEYYYDLLQVQDEQLIRNIMRFGEDSTFEKYAHIALNKEGKAVRRPSQSSY